MIVPAVLQEALGTECHVLVGLRHGYFKQQTSMQWLGTKSVEKLNCLSV
jgi:hypothetical protein